MQTRPQNLAIYTRSEALATALNDTLGHRAKVATRAEYLGIDPTSLWRFLYRDDTKVGHQFVINALAAFPTLTFEDLFEICEERPPSEPKRERKREAVAA